MNFLPPADIVLRVFNDMSFIRKIDETGWNVLQLQRCEELKALGNRHSEIHLPVDDQAGCLEVLGIIVG